MDLKDAFDLLYDKAAQSLLWLAVALVGLGLIVGLLLFFFKRDKMQVFVKYAIVIAAGVALCALTVMTTMKIEINKVNPYVDMSIYGLIMYPVIAEIMIGLVGMLAIMICSLFGKKAAKIAGISTGALLLGGFIAIIVEMSKYYQIVGNTTGYDTSTTGLIVSAVIIMALIALIYFLGKKRNISDTRSIVYGAVAIALSFALSYAKFFEMPQGGSVTFASLLPLMIYCCMFGTRRGTIVCLLYGLLQAVQDPYILHPMQFLLDYPLAFGLIGVSGIFVEKNVFKFKGKLGNFNQMLGFVCGAAIAVTARYISHVLSGIFAFASIGAGVKAALVYSLTYNSFAFIDMLIAMAAGCLLFLSKAFTSQMAKSSDIGKSVASAESAIEIEDEDDGFVYLDDVKQADKTEDVILETENIDVDNVEVNEAEADTENAKNLSE